MLISKMHTIDPTDAKTYNPGEGYEAITKAVAGSETAYAIVLPKGEKARLVRLWAESEEGAERLGTTGLSVTIQGRVLDKACKLDLDPDDVRPYLERIESYADWDQSARDFLSVYGGKSPSDPVAQTSKSFEALKRNWSHLSANQLAELQAMVDDDS